MDLIVHRRSFRFIFHSRVVRPEQHVEYRVGHAVPGMIVQMMVKEMLLFHPFAPWRYRHYGTVGDEVLPLVKELAEHRTEYER
jgi:hypothetical protein